jgi:phenylalanine-4-hydroxylase
MAYVQDAPELSDDCIVPQRWDDYTDVDHAIWRRLFERQSRLLPGRACDAYLAGLKGLGVAADGIPDFERLSEILDRATGWRIVAVPGLVPDDVFFAHLAARRFPATNWIRSPEQMDYLQEPDAFHDVFGHVPMLMNPVFADYMAAYGRGGLKALALGALPKLARLYWYTVEFGLIRTAEGLRIYGSGIVSSHGESLFSLEDAKPDRILFDLLRVMRTTYRIDAYQDCYFVIDSFEQLFDATRPDFTAYYEILARLSDITPGARLAEDSLYDVPASEAAP